MDLARLERELRRRPVAADPAGSGASGSVRRLRFADGSTLIAKSARDDDTDLTLEARSLALLAARSALPVPRVHFAAPDLLIMDDMPGSPTRPDRAEPHAARLLAQTHSITSADDTYGLDFDGLIGPLPQLNTPASSWVEFFRDRRLLFMTEAAASEAALPASLARRLHTLADRLPDLIPARPPPALIHGDVWSGNILTTGAEVTAFLDPAPYHAHAEIELAFITLFSTFGETFFNDYRARTGTDAATARDFERSRRHVYNTYPLLVHIRIFGGGYVGELDSTLRAIGL